MLKIVLFQVAVYLILDIIAKGLSEYYGDNYDNGWVFNINAVVELTLLTYVARIYFNNNWSRYVQYFLVGLFFLLLGCEMILFPGKYRLAEYSILFEGFFLGCFYLIVVFSELRKRKTMKEKLPIIVASLGMIIYFLGTLPYLSMLFYFQDKDSSLNDNLFLKIVISLAWVRYLLISIAFILSIRIKSQLS